MTVALRARRRIYASGICAIVCKGKGVLPQRRLMTEQAKGFTELTKDPIADAIVLLTHYSYDLRGDTIEALVSQWVADYNPAWIRLAVIETLYQGRYKAISVEQILALWKRRGQPLHHFNHEFERLVCNKLPKSFSAQPDARSEDATGQPDAIATLLRSLHEDVTHGTISEPPELVSEPVETASMSVPNGLTDPASSTPVESVPGATSPPASPAVEPVAPVDSDSSKSPETEAIVSSSDSYRNPLALPPAAEFEVQATVEAGGIETPAIASPDFDEKAEPPQSSLEPIEQVTSETEVAVPTPTAESLTARKGIEDPALDAYADEVGTLLQMSPTPSTRQGRTSYETDWLNAASHHPINQFTPISESSEFYSKLRSVAYDERSHFLE